MTLRDKLARAIHGCHPDDCPWHDLGSAHQDMWLSQADAVLALLRAEPVSDDAIAVFMAVEDEESEGMSDDMPLDDARRWLRRAGLQAGIRAWLGSPEGQQSGNSPRDTNRCAVCGWPLVNKDEVGCWRGNCSLRPRPDKLYDVARAAIEARMCEDA